MRLSLACSPTSARAPPASPKRIVRSPIFEPPRCRDDPPDRPGRRAPRLRRLLRLGVGIDQLAGGVFRRPQDGLAAVVSPLVEAVALDAVVLHLEHPRLGPFAVGAVFDLALDGLERVAADIVGELVLVEALGPLDRL